MNELLAYFEKELPGINAFLEAEAEKLDGLVRDVARHTLLAGGKRIRPLMTILCARILGYQGGAEVLPMACALEMLHSATLIHDDILDGADQRRKKPAAHIRFGVVPSILAGDVLLALANKLGASYGISRLSALLAEGIMATAGGEVMELEHVAKPGFDRQAYMEIIIGKTARLIETACRCGAALAGADRSAEDAVGEFGLNMGIAFQLVDDALDFAPAEVTGKPAGGDLREGKVTLPVLIAYQCGDEADRAFWQRCIAEGDIQDGDLEAAIARLKATEAIAGTIDRAVSYGEVAKANLAPFPDSAHKRALIEVVDFCISRVS